MESQIQSLALNLDAIIGYESSNGMRDFNFAVSIDQEREILAAFSKFSPGDSPARILVSICEQESANAQSLGQVVVLK